ncbi:MAG: hypothetical protein ABI123_02870 [Ginsengibacter sp.]|jgi:hypothetical protein
MKTKYLLLIGLIVILGSCSTTYRSGQTPDDVYYSPAPQNQDSYANNNGDEEGSYYYDDNDGSYYSSAQEDRDIRRGIYDRSFRNSISINLGLGMGGYSSFGYNPFGYYSYNPYSFNHFGYGYPFGYSSYGYGFSPFGYSSYYNPFFSGYNGYYPYYGSGYGNGFNHGLYTSNRYYNTNTNRGPRRTNLNAYNDGIRPAKTFSPRSIRSNGDDLNNNRAPVRSITRPGQARAEGLDNSMRRVLSPERSNNLPVESNNRATPRRLERSNNNYNESNRRYTPRVERSSSTPVESNRRSTPRRVERNNESSRSYTPTQSTETRSYENNNRSNQAPVRSSTPSPSYNAPSAPPSNSGNSAPVRSIRRG